MKNWKTISIVSISINIILAVFIFAKINMVRVVEVKNQTSTNSSESDDSDVEENFSQWYSNTYNFEQGFSITLPGDLMRISLDGSNTIGSYGEEAIALFVLENSNVGGEFVVSMSDRDPGEALLAEYKKIPAEQIEYGDFGYSEPELFVKTLKNTFYHVGVGRAGHVTETVWTRKGSKYIVFTFMGEGDVMERYKSYIILNYQETN